MMKFNCILLFVFSFLLSICSVSVADDATEVMKLQEALIVANQQNPTIVEARKKVEIFESRFKGSKKITNPELDIDVAKIAYDLEDEAKFDDRTLEGEVRLNQLIQTWGKRGLSIKIAEDELSQARYELQGLWLDISHEVKKQYNETLLQQKSIELTSDHLERAQRFFEQVNIQFNSGKARNHELARAKLEVSTARNAFLEAETRFYVSMGKLNILLGQNIQDEIRLEDNLTPVELDSQMKDLLEFAVKERADILSQNHELSKKEKQLKLAKRQRLPDVNLGLFVEREEEIYSAGAGLSFELPLWNQFQQDIKEASLEKEIAEIHLDTLKKEVTLNVYAAYKNAQLAWQSLLNLEQSIKEANELLRILNIEYQEGEATFLVYLEGLTSFKETKQNYLASLANYNDKIAELEQAVGKTLMKEEQ
ncbi:MAG: TolC family protein [Candidatus Omnitrophica bacterium]|nr:TolC family protein [Candidatus Omnitrophota bacterium]